MFLLKLTTTISNAKPFAKSAALWLKVLMNKLPVKETVKE
jgi:hypothetical protein